MNIELASVHAYASTFQISTFQIRGRNSWPKVAGIRVQFSAFCRLQCCIRMQRHMCIRNRFLELVPNTHLYLELMVPNTHVYLEPFFGTGSKYR